MNVARRLDVVVLGNANVDLIRDAQGNEHRTPGGKGLNQAVASSRAGASVALITRVGAGPEGDFLLSAMRAEGVQTEYVVRDHEAPTGRCRIELEGSQPKFLHYDANANANLTLDDIRAAKAILSEARVLACGLSVPAPCVELAVQIAKATDTYVILDPSPPALPDALWPMIDLMKPDAEEIEVLCGHPVEDREAASVAARTLMRRGVISVAIEVEKQGNLFAWPGGEVWLERCEVDVVDTTGAGDAMIGMFTAHVALERSLAEAAPIAHAAAAIATTGIGGAPNMPTRSQARQLLRASEKARLEAARRPLVGQPG